MAGAGINCNLRKLNHLGKLTAVSLKEIENLI